MDILMGNIKINNKSMKKDKMEMEKLNQCIEDVLDFDYQHLTTDDSDGRSFYFALKRLEDYYENLKEDESGIVFKTQDDQGVRIWLHAQDHLTEEDPKALFNTHQATVHLDEIQAMLDDGLPVYIEINADITRRWLYDFTMITDMEIMAGDIIKLTRDSITDILGIPMINAQNYLWPTDTYRAIIPVEEAGISSVCSKCVFEKHECDGIGCFNCYYEYRQVITDGHKVVEEDCTPVEIMCTEIDNMKRDDTVFFIKFKEFEDCDSYSLHLTDIMMEYSGKLFIVNSGTEIKVCNMTTPTIFFEGFYWPIDTFTVLVPGTPESGPCYSIPCGSGAYVERTPVWPTEEEAL
jgi:hypothetical protein